ncbi:hypothetical protein [Roseovarius aestuariivivens]|uniref:hypothetical protein n=1 Tax=Roseovarius aestuariivivens TaxID=1888910 RepID=UPI001080552E|nr:hypothetical protein [Roseovarius aestuariivivens]
MLTLLTLVIGGFFAVCLLMHQPLYLLWPPPLLLVFAGGLIVAYCLKWRGWAAYLAPRVTVLQGGLAVLAALVAPVLIGMALTFGALQRLDLPEDRVDLSRSIGPDIFHITFLSPMGIDALRAHFAAHHDIRYWRDVPTPDNSDDPAALLQSVTPSQSQAYWILLSKRDEETFVEIGGPYDRPAPVLLIALAGGLVLAVMLLLGPPRSHAPGQRHDGP